MPQSIGTDWQWNEITGEEFFRRKPEEGSAAFGGWSKGQGETMTGWGRDGETAPRLATVTGGGITQHFERIERRECNNESCGWSGPLSETVHPKHDDSMVLCPVCNETTEEC